MGVRADAAEEVRAKAKELIDDYESGGQTCVYDCLIVTVDCVGGRCQTVESGQFSTGCNPGGGDPACPLSRPPSDAVCSEGLCCNYESMSGTVGCICGADGWTCTPGQCSCTGA